METILRLFILGAVLVFMVWILVIQLRDLNKEEAEWDQIVNEALLPDYVWFRDIALRWDSGRARYWRDTFDWGVSVSKVGKELRSVSEFPELNYVLLVPCTKEDYDNYNEDY